MAAATLADAVFEEEEVLCGVEVSEASGAATFVLAVLGDLHLEPGQMPLFLEARMQIVDTLRRLVSGSLESEALASSGSFSARPLPVSSEATAKPSGCRTYVVQLGDVGGYMNNPGSAACFEAAVDFLDGFGFPRLSITGNHDLEGAEFETDAANLAAWQHAFGQNHFWAEDLGAAGVCIGLSTVQFRDAEDSCHEVFIDDAQFAWFEERLWEYQDRPVLVFSHAPPMGCGLTSLQEVHVRNRCAWLNHSKDPHKFLNLVRRHPNIKLWFSGHFHLSHDYEGSVSRVGTCLFVQTGVMGGCHRDGRRHSRLLVGNAVGYRLMTLDHCSGDVRTDVVHAYANEARSLPPQRLWCSAVSFLQSCPGGGAFSPEMPADVARRDKDQFPAQLLPLPVTWLQHGHTILAIHANQIVEYEAATRAPIGVVCPGVNGRQVHLVLDSPGRGEEEGESVPEHGQQPVVAGAVDLRSRSHIAAIELVPTEESSRMARSERKLTGGVEYERLERNSKGGFWRVFQVNKWRLKQERAAAQAAVAAAEAAAPVTAAT